MTIEEIKKEYGAEDRSGYIYCQNCPLDDVDDNNDDERVCPLGCSGYDDAYLAIQKYFKQHPEEEPTVKQEVTNDVVNHPAHYCREGGMESIEEMVLVFGKEAVKNFCLCNVWKYRYRAADKNGEEDLHKSDWYMRKYKELCANE